MVNSAVGIVSSYNRENN